MSCTSVRLLGLPRTGCTQNPVSRGLKLEPHQESHKQACSWYLKDKTKQEDLASHFANISRPLKDDKLATRSLLQSGTMLYGTYTHLSHKPGIGRLFQTNKQNNSNPHTFWFSMTASNGRKRSSLQLSALERCRRLVSMVGTVSFPPFLAEQQFPKNEVLSTAVSVRFGVQITAGSTCCDITASQKKNCNLARSTVRM